MSKELLSSGSVLITHAELSTTTGCMVCGGKAYGEWATSLGLKGKLPFYTGCQRCTHVLLGKLLRRYIRIKQGDRPAVIDPRPILKEAEDGSATV